MAGAHSKPRIPPEKEEWLLFYLMKDILKERLLEE